MAQRVYNVGTVALQTTGAPATATLAAVTVSGLSSGTAYVKVTYVTAAGESLASTEASQSLSANQGVQVTSPAAAAGATGYNVYAAMAAGAETKQTATPIAIGTNWTEPAGGLTTTGALPPIIDTSLQQTIAMTAVPAAAVLGLNIAQLYVTSTSSSNILVSIQNGSTTIFSAFVNSTNPILEPFGEPLQISAGNTLNFIAGAGAATIALAYNVIGFIP